MNNETLEQLIKTLEVLTHSHRHDLIVEHAKKILTLQPDNLQATAALVNAYYRMEQYDNMYTVIQRALSLWPTNPWFYERLFWYYLGTGERKYLLAKKAIETAIALDPNRSYYYRDLGELYLINREPQKAARCLAQAVELNPQSAECRSRLALALLRCKQKNKSLEIASKALRDDPNHAGVLDNVGMILILSGELDEAEELFRSALKKSPTYGYYQKHLDWVLREKKDREVRELQNKKYTPLYLRHKGTKRFFDEDADK